MKIPSRLGLQIQIYEVNLYEYDIFTCKLKIRLPEVIIRIRTMYNHIYQSFTAFYLHGRPVRFEFTKLYDILKKKLILDLKKKFPFFTKNVEISVFCEILEFELTGFCRRLKINFFKFTTFSFLKLNIKIETCCMQATYRT